MGWLESLPGWAVFAGTLILVVATAVGINFALHRYVRPNRRESIGMTAAAYMTALGSLFAILTGFLINSEYSTLRHTQDLVAQETAASARLAFAPDALPGVERGH